jgi:hypothetical protein
MVNRDRIEEMPCVYHLRMNWLAPSPAFGLGSSDSVGVHESDLGVFSIACITCMINLINAYF